MLTNYEQLAARDAASKVDYANALFQIEKLRAALIEYKAGYDGVWSNMPRFEK